MQKHIMRNRIKSSIDAELQPQNKEESYPEHYNLCNILKWNDWNGTLEGHYDAKVEDKKIKKKACRGERNAGS